MKRYIIVSHSWFIDSNGFETKQIEAADDREAKDKAILFREARNRPFNHTETFVLKIGPHEELYQPRRLTLWERISGWAV